MAPYLLERDNCRYGAAWRPSWRLCVVNLISAISARDNRPRSGDSTAIVAALYAEHALGLTRLAQVMLGDRAAGLQQIEQALVQGRGGVSERVRVGTGREQGT